MGTVKGEAGCNPLDEVLVMVKLSGGIVTNNIAGRAASVLGYKKTNYFSQKRPIYYNSNTSKDIGYIVFDQTSHNGGFWKAASSVENLGSDITRTGTFDIYLNYIGK